MLALFRYYTDQKKFDTIATNALKDDFKRKGRELKERDAEAQMLDTVYQVPNVDSYSLLSSKLKSALFCEAAE